MGGKQRSDSLTSRRIVLAFLDFLKFVEPAPGVDLEGLDVVRECLEEVFRLKQSSIDDGIQPGMLIDLFTSSEADDQLEFKPAMPPTTMDHMPLSASTSQQSESFNHLASSNKEEQVADIHHSGQVSDDEIRMKYLTALDKMNFFNPSANGFPDLSQCAKAFKYFDDAEREVKNSEGRVVNFINLAEELKSKGNQSMQYKLYSEAVELYTCAIALCEKNAIYYCNRAAAYTQLHRYSEAIEDCLKSIEIDPRYSKGYSRLGVAYYSQGKYSEALNQGFLKALQLDPSNNSVKEGIQAAQQKLMEQDDAAEADESTGSSSGQESSSSSSSSSQSSGSTSHGIPFESIPVEFANILRNMASASQVNHERTPSTDAEGEEPNEPRITANVSVHIGQAPEGISDALRFVVEMISQQRAQGDVTE